MLKPILFALCVITLTACASGGKISDIDVGMSKNEIMSRMGTPDNSYHDGDMEVLIYMDKKEKIWSSEKHNYQIVLINDITAQIAPENTRSEG